MHRRAFVIQIGPEADPEAGRLEGRVEHVASGASTRFSRAEELLAFLARTVATLGQPGANLAPDSASEEAASPLPRAPARGEPDPSLADVPPRISTP